MQTIILDVIPLNVITDWRGKLFLQIFTVEVFGPEFIEETGLF